MLVNTRLLLVLHNFHYSQLIEQMQILKYVTSRTKFIINYSLGYYFGRIKVMDQNLSTIAEFLTSKQCILNLSKIDYPTILQQKMITSYFQYSNIVKKQHDQIIRVLHTANQRSLEAIVIGIAYKLMLHPQNPQLCLQHLKTLKSQAWQFLSNNLEQILLESFQDIKIQHRIGLAIIYSQLSYYHFLKDSVTIMIVKTLDCFDFSQMNLTYVQYALDSFSLIFEKQQHSTYEISKQSKQSIGTLSKFLFFKLLRLYANLTAIEDKNIKQLKQKCFKMIVDLWNKNQKQYLFYGNQLCRFLQQIQLDPSIEVLCAQIRQKLLNNQQRVSWGMREVAVSSLLPIRVQTTLIFMMRQRVSRHGIWYQVNWLIKDQFKKGDTAFMLLVDMARWITITNANIQQKIYILEYLYQKCMERPQIAELFKQALLLDWFQQGTNINMLHTSLNFIQYTCSTEFKLGEQLLAYLLAHKDSQRFYHKIKQTLLQAAKQGIIKLNFYMQNDFFSSKVKGQLQQLFDNADQQGVPLQFDPSESAQDIQYEADFSFQNNENQISRKMSQQNIVQREVKCTYSVNLNCDFIDDMEKPLRQLLQKPLFINFNTFLQKVINVTKKYRKEGQTQQIQLILRQTAKVIYLMFNSQFQQFGKISQDNNVLLAMLRVIISEWKLNNFRVQIYKKIIKSMIDMFPVTQFSFWKVFLQNFRRGPASHKQVFEWLFQKQKQSYVRDSLQLLMGTNVSSIESNAISYSIWTRK